MNYFFLLTKEGLQSNLSIPKFQNTGLFCEDLKLYGARVEKEKWKFFQPKYVESNYFWKLDSNDQRINDIFFLASEKNFTFQLNSNKLLDLNTFTNTFPDYRANLSIKNELGAISSYQSEYPFQMTTKTGSIYSSISTLGNFDAKVNGVFVRNIHHLPKEDNFEGFVYDLITKKVLKSFTLISNKCNFISFEDLQDNGSLVLYCKGYLGVPVYYSESSNGSLSLEHTHPPHENIQGVDRYKLVTKKKKYLDEKISETFL